MNVVTLVEGKRGCGYRKPGRTGVGIYLVGSGVGFVCGRLPFPLHVCPCCGGGVKFSRGFTWITPSRLFAPDVDPVCDPNKAYKVPREISRVPGPLSMAGGCRRSCYMNGELQGQHGLLWVGERHYTPDQFTREALAMGVSRRLPSVPLELKFGETVVFFAHNKAIQRLEQDENGQQIVVADPGVFFAFKPQGVDLVVDPSDVPDRAINILERVNRDNEGDPARLVEVMPEQEQPGLFDKMEGESNE